MQISIGMLFIGVATVPAHKAIFVRAGRAAAGRAGGAIDTGRHLKIENGTPLTNLYLSMLDMVGAKNLDLPVEKTTWGWADSRPFVESIWLTAEKLGVVEFQKTLAPNDVLDDHIPLHEIGKIPSVDIIQRFPWALWHTTQDTPENCSPLSLAKVGWVLTEWLNAQK